MRGSFDSIASDAMAETGEKGIIVGVSRIRNPGGREREREGGARGGEPVRLAPGQRPTYPIRFHHWVAAASLAANICNT